MGELLRMVIFSELPGQFWALYLSTKGEKAAEETVSFALKESTMCTRRRGAARPSSNK